MISLLKLVAEISATTFGDLPDCLTDGPFTAWPAMGVIWFFQWSKEKNSDHIV